METITQQSPVATAYADYTSKIPFRVKPDERFYTSVGINPKRFGQLLRGDAEPLASEIKALATYFGIPPTDLL